MRWVALRVLALMALVPGVGDASPEAACAGLAPAAVGTGPGPLPLEAGAEVRPATACEAARAAADAAWEAAEDAEARCTAAGAALGLEGGTFQVGGLRIHTGLQGGATACSLLDGWRDAAEDAHAFAGDMCGIVARFVGPAAAGLC